MDIQKLITLGKMEETVKLGDIEFHITTPAIDDLTKAQDNIDLLAVCITAIGDKEFITPEDKDGLKKALRAMQGVVIGKLVDRVGKLADKQSKLLEDNAKK